MSCALNRFSNSTKMRDVALRLHPSAANPAVHETYAWCINQHVEFIWSTIFGLYTYFWGNIAHYVHYKD